MKTITYTEAPLLPAILPLEWKVVRDGAWLRAEPAPGVFYEVKNDETAEAGMTDAVLRHRALVLQLLAPMPAPRTHKAALGEDDRDHLAVAMERMDAARDFPKNTCPASRHVQMLTEALAKGEPFPMLQDDPQHVASSLARVLSALYEARSDLATLTWVAVPELPGDTIEIDAEVLEAADRVATPTVLEPSGDGDVIEIDESILDDSGPRI